MFLTRVQQVTMPEGGALACSKGLSAVSAAAREALADDAVADSLIDLEVGEILWAWNDRIEE